MTPPVTDPARFEAAFAKALAKGKTRLPLPRRTRARLAIVHAIDGTAIWLTGHRRHDAALRLWRVTRLVRKP